MRDIHGMRLLVQTVDRLNKEKADDFIMHALGAAYDGIERVNCIGAFREAYPKYSKQAEELCDSAIAREYLSTADKVPIPKDEIRLFVNPLKGRTLLTRTGYINELADSVGKIPPILTWAVALTSLAVSVFVAIRK